MDFIIFINYCVLSGDPRHLHIVLFHSHVPSLGERLLANKMCSTLQQLLVQTHQDTDPAATCRRLISRKISRLFQGRIFSFVFVLGVYAELYTFVFLRTDILQRDLLLSLEI